MEARESANIENRIDTSIEFLTAFCIPTADRPELLESLLLNLIDQNMVPDYILVVDASKTDAAEKVCQKLTDRFPSGCLRFEKWSRGLTLQRRRGVEVLQEIGKIRYVCMLDDDVLLAPDFLEKIVSFMESGEGRVYGGVSGYEMRSSGSGFSRLEMLYSHLKLFNGELKPGRWLYCGDFTQISRLQPFAGIYPTEFVGGGLTVWRMAVFDQFLPPVQLTGFRGGEDKHLSLRVGTAWKLGVMGEAQIWHYSAPGGARPGKFRTAYLEMRNKAIILRDCDPNPKIIRYLAFMAFNGLHMWVRLFFLVFKLEYKQMTHFMGSLSGWIHNFFAPPRRTVDALTGSRAKLKQSTSASPRSVK